MWPAGPDRDRIRGSSATRRPAPAAFRRPACGRSGAGVDLAARTLRIEEAKQMLETTDATINAIAAEVGCTETAAFRRMFKRATGLAPLPIGRGSGMWRRCRRHGARLCSGNI
ncbi:MAG: helix-turn-helix domain-containing protein [Cereibacter changlensis]